MSVERMIWLVLGLALVIWAVIMLFSDEPSLDQDEIDVIQNFVLGGIALGLAARSR
jgi:RsiW-degrading membrane proteinase PrsW (M82 family)